MKKSNIRILLLVILSLMILVLPAQQLIKTQNNETVPYVGRSWEALTMACTADTVWTKVTVPAGTYQMTMRPTASIKVAADSVYAASNNTEFAVTDTTLYVDLPVSGMTEFWIRRAVAETAASLKILFRKW